MARAPSPDPAFAYAGPVYLIAALLVGFSLLDYFATIWPVNPSEISWRYGSVGILTGFALTPLLGLLLATGAATLSGHRVVLRAIGILGIIVGVLFVLLLLGFTLDVLQIRRDTPAEGRPLFDLGAIKAVVKHLGVALAWAWLGLRGWRQSRIVGGTHDRSGAASLVVR